MAVVHTHVGFVGWSGPQLIIHTCTIQPFKILLVVGNCILMLFEFIMEVEMRRLRAHIPLIISNWTY